MLAEPIEVPKLESVWDRIDAAMTAKNWRPAELARQAHVSPSSITHWKNGDSQPSRGELAKVAKALGVTMDQLAGATEMPDLRRDAGRLSKPESDLVVLYRGNERFRRIVNNIIAELELTVEEPE